MEVIVLDGGVKSALASVRSLGRAGARIACGAERPSAMALQSRYVARRFTYRSPLLDPEGFLTDLARAIGEATEPPVIYAFSDATALLLSRHRDRFLACARFALPSKDAVEIAADKSRTLALAASLSIPVPEYIKASSTKDVEDACERFSFPLVIKPKRSVTFFDTKGVLGRVSFAFLKKEAMVLAEKERQTSGAYPLVMRYVRGAEYGFEALVKEGTVLRYVAHKRVRSLSPSGGAAVVKETIEPDARMKESAFALLRALSWTGVAMLEFKQSESGAFLLLEINGRFWGSLPLSIFAGCDFPLLYATLSRGEPLPRERPDAYVRGVRSRHLLGDIKHLLSVWFSKDPMRAIAYPSRVSSLVSFLGSFFASRYDVFAFSDPLPFFAEAFDKAR